MGEIKEYKPLALVYYIDGNGNRNALPLDEEKVPQFKKALEECKMVELEGVVINTFDIKEIRPSEFTTEAEKYFYSRNIAERKYLTDKVRKMVKNPKANVFEEMLCFDNPVKKMDEWITSKFYNELPKEVVGVDELGDEIQQVKVEDLTEEQKNEIKTRFKNLQYILAQ